MINAGANTAINGGSFKDRFTDALLSNVGSQLHAEGAKLIGDLAQNGYIGLTEKALSHAVVAAMAAEIGKGNGKGAAAGALAASIAGITMGDTFADVTLNLEKRVMIERILGAVVGGIATNSASGANSAANAAEIVQRYNDALHIMYEMEQEKKFYEYLLGSKEKAEQYLLAKNKAKVEGARDELIELADKVMHPLDTAVDIATGLYTLVTEPNKVYKQIILTADEWTTLYQYALEHDPVAAGQMDGYLEGRIGTGLIGSVILSKAAVDVVQKIAKLKYAGKGTSGAVNNGTTGTVWDSIKSTQPNYPNSAIPKSFEMTLPNGQKVWVHGNATEHMAEYAASKAVTHTPEAVRLTSQEQLK